MKLCLLGSDSLRLSNRRVGGGIKPKVGVYWAKQPRSGKNIYSAGLEDIHLKIVGHKLFHRQSHCFCLELLSQRTAPYIFELAHGNIDRWFAARFDLETITADQTENC